MCFADLISLPCRMSEPHLKAAEEEEGEEDGDGDGDGAVAGGITSRQKTEAHRNSKARIWSPAPVQCGLV